MSEESGIIEKVYTLLPEPVRPYILGLMVTSAVVVVIKQALPLVPLSRRTKRRKAIDGFLAAPSTGSENKKEGGVVVHDQIVIDHFIALREEDAFLDVTGIRCKRESRQLWIELYQKCGDNWTWRKLASVAQFLKPQNGELRYWIRVRDYLLDILFSQMVLVSAAGIIAVLFNFGRVSALKQVGAVVSVLSVLSVVLAISIAMLLPLKRLQRLRKQCALPRFDPRTKPVEKVTASVAAVPAEISV